MELEQHEISTELEEIKILQTGEGDAKIIDYRKCCVQYMQGLPQDSKLPSIARQKSRRTIQFSVEVTIVLELFRYRPHCARM